MKTYIILLAVYLVTLASSIITIRDKDKEIKRLKVENNHLCYYTAGYLKGLVRYKNLYSDLVTRATNVTFYYQLGDGEAGIFNGMHHEPLTFCFTNYDLPLERFSKDN